MSELHPEQILLIQNEVENRLSKIAKIFGVANVVVLIGAIWAFWASAPDIIASRIDPVIGEASKKLNEAKSTADQTLGALSEISKNISSSSSAAEQLKKDVSFLKNNQQLKDASQFLSDWKDNENAQKILANLNAKVSIDNQECQTAKIFAKTINSDNLNSKEYRNSNNVLNPNAMRIAIDTSIAGFQKHAIYFASIGGNGGMWSVNGMNAILSPTNKNFNLVLKWTGDASNSSAGAMLAYAKNYKWTINWVGIGC